MNEFLKKITHTTYMSK